MQRPSTPQPRSAPSGMEAMLEGQMQRVKRVLVFVHELIGQFKKEFGELWLDRPTDPALAAFVDKVAQLEAQWKAGDQLMARLPSMKAGEALKAVYAFGIDRLAAEAQAVQQAARAVRQSRARPEPAPAAPQPQPTGLAGLLRKLKTSLEAEEAPPPPPPRPDAALEKAIQAFTAARAFVSGVLAYVSPRLQLAAVALEATGLPGKKKPWPEVAKAVVAQSAGFDPSQRGWLPPLTKLVYEQPTATQAVHMAVVQWQETRALDVQADLLEAALETAEPARKGTLLASFDAGKYRAAAFPLGHLHLRFRGQPPLDTLFPPVETSAALGGTQTGRLVSERG